MWHEPGRQMSRHPFTALLAAVAHVSWALGAGPALVRHRHDGGRLPHVHLAETLAALAHERHDEHGHHHHDHHHDHHHHDRHDDHRTRDVHAPDAPRHGGGPRIGAGNAGDHAHSVPLLGGAPRAAAPPGPGLPSAHAAPTSFPIAPPTAAIHVAQPRAPPPSLVS
jgi:hypothetical protein